MVLLGDVVLLEQVWSCWKNCITVDVGFEVSYMFKAHPVLPMGQDVRTLSSFPSTMCADIAALLPTMSIMD